MNDERDTEEREESGEAAVDQAEDSAGEAAEAGSGETPDLQKAAALAGRQQGLGRLTGPRKGGSW